MNNTEIIFEPQVEWYSYQAFNEYSVVFIPNPVDK